MKNNKTKKRNNALFDRWSLVHVASGVAMGAVINPFVAILLLAFWEPFEVLLLSPYLARRGITFGYETLRNSLSDIFFDIVGVAIGALIVRL